VTSRRVVVNDRMQMGYVYVRSAPAGRDFDPPDSAHRHAQLAYGPGQHPHLRRVHPAGLSLDL